MDVDVDTYDTVLLAFIASSRVVLRFVTVSNDYELEQDVRRALITAVDDLARRKRLQLTN
ncbi:hypothetical protein QIJ82_gp1 [ssRNA phage Gephyllon.4_13]|uniref:Uncharacterized protein n=2 Tax=unclassified Fiersviridae TaxID=2852980 RepID=A0A8S5L3B1_9VIRU|nr:hypothetical protein QIJ82_gp1 [ssRNA phage Gephyllon.4_13]DAD51987.1 TPA_asm: hypothetical protein [ssRNA phage Gephyllon.4_13]